MGIAARGHLTNTAAAFVSTCIAVLLLGLRAPDVFTHPQMWAEDATVYWLQQFEHGSVAILWPYDSYLQLLPRLGAWLAAFFAYGWAPNIFAVYCVAVTAWTAATIATASVSPWLGLMLGVTLLAPPHPNGEVFGNITNLQWLTAPALAVIAGTPPPSGRLRQVNQLAFSFLAALSGPFSIFLIPILGWRFWQHWDLVSFAGILCAAIQLTVIISTGGGPIPGNRYDPIVMTSHFVLRIAASPIAQIVTVLLLVTCLIPGQDRTLRMSFALLGIAVLATTLLKFINVSSAFDSELNGPRYFYIPQLMLLWIALSMCFTRYFPIAVAWLLVFTVTYRTDLFQRQRDDKRWSSYSAEIGVRPVTIPINPEGWSVTVPPLKKPASR